MIFQSTLPSIGAGRLLSRDDARGYEANSKEHELRNPADNFYKSMAAECSRQQVCVDVFCTSVPYADIASMCVLPKYTGGDVRYYPQFSLAKDEVKFKTELTRNLTRDVAFGARKDFACVRSTGTFSFVRSICSLYQPRTRIKRTRCISRTTKLCRTCKRVTFSARCCTPRRMVNAGFEFTRCKCRW